MLMKFKLLMMFILLPSMVSAATCKRLIDCIVEVSNLTGIRYIYPENMIGTKLELNTEFVFDKTNADAVLSEALAFFEFMRIPTKVENVWKIIPGMDIRYHADIPAFTASKKNTPKLPLNHDPIQLTYQAQEGTSVANIAMNLRPLASRYGRILDVRTGMIIIIDRASNVAKMLPIIQATDSPLSKEEKQLKEKEQQRQHELELARIKAQISTKPNP
jgi:hypothetical protein